MVKYANTWARSSTVEQYPLKVLVRGSNPLGLTKKVLVYFVQGLFVGLEGSELRDATE